MIFIQKKQLFLTQKCWRSWIRTASEIWRNIDRHPVVIASKKYRRCRRHLRRHLRLFFRWSEEIRKAWFETSKYRIRSRFETSKYFVPKFRKCKFIWMNSYRNYRQNFWYNLDGIWTKSGMQLQWLKLKMSATYHLGWWLFFVFFCNSASCDITSMCDVL